MKGLHEIPFYCPMLPKSQLTIQNAMIKAGYHIPSYGACFGLTQMLILEALTSDAGLTRYAQRLAKINYYINVFGSLENYIEYQQNGCMPTSGFRKNELMEILAFLDGVALYQNPIINSDFVQKSEAYRQINSNVNAILAPIKLEKAGQTILASTPKIGSYTQKSFADYLDKITTHFKNIPFCLEISTINHQCALVYDPGLESVVFVDPNRYDLIGTKENPAKQVFSSLDSSSGIILSTKVCVNSTHHTFFDEFCSQDSINPIQNTMTSLTRTNEIEAFLVAQIRTNDVAAIHEILAFVSKHNTAQEMQEIITNTIKYSAGYDDAQILSILVEASYPIERCSPPTAGLPSHIVLAFLTALSTGSINNADFLLKKYPDLIRYPQCLRFAAINQHSLTFILSHFGYDKQTEYLAMRVKGEEGDDALFISASNSNAFCVMLNKYLEDPKYFTSMSAGDFSSLMHQLLKYPASLEVFLKIASSNPFLNNTTIEIIDEGIFEEQRYTGRLFHRALQYPRSFRAILAFLPKEISLRELQESPEPATPYISPLPSPILRSSAKYLMEYFLSDRPMLTYILSCYPLEQQLQLLCLDTLAQGNREIPLYESDCFTECFKDRVRACLMQDEATVHKLSPLSSHGIYNEIAVSPTFIDLFENALCDPPTFSTLLTSIPEDALYQRVICPLDNHMNLLMRSIHSPECFEKLLNRLKNRPGLITRELILACLDLPSALPTLFNYVSFKEFFRIFSEAFHPSFLIQEYPKIFSSLLEKDQSALSIYNQIQRLFSTPKRESTTTTEIKKEDQNLNQ